jgi:flavin-binding protein dodecin
MNELSTWAGSVSATIDERSPTAPTVAVAPLEFVGSSDHTIAEAVRRALMHASTSLQTLDGVGVKVIPEIDPRANHPRFRVTLHVSPQGTPPDTSRS